MGVPARRDLIPPGPLSPQVEKGGDVERNRFFVRVLIVNDVVFNTCGVGDERYVYRRLRCRLWKFSHLRGCTVYTDILLVCCGPAGSFF